MSETPRRHPQRTPRRPRREASPAELDEVFGDVLPDTTSDERPEPGQAPDRDDDAWYLENRPPHH